MFFMRKICQNAKSENIMRSSQQVFFKLKKIARKVNEKD